MKHNYEIIFGTGHACILGGVRRSHNFARRRRNPARRLTEGPVSALTELTPTERELLRSLARGDKPWAVYAGGSWNKLLTRSEANPKIAKGLKSGIATAVLHLAPYDASGKNVCIFATPGCASACLNTAGRGGIPGKAKLEEIELLTGEFYAPPNSIQRARVLKTLFFLEDRALFMERLVSAVAGFVEWARSRRFLPAIRLNGTSDILWENIGFDYGGHRYSSIMQAFPGVQFYDYTKNPYRGGGVRPLPPNYHLTFSVADYTKKNADHADVALANGMNLTVVFNVKKGRPLPASWGGIPVIDADLHDMRFLDNQEHGIKGPLIAGLHAKGRAIKDSSGFVRDAGGPEDEFSVGAIVWEPHNQPIFEVYSRGRR